MTDTLTPEERPSEIVGGDGHGLLTLPNGRSIPFKAHPLADLFPMMSADEMAALVEDVRERGVQRPIVMLDDMVLDGRNRYFAAREAEVGYRVVEFTGDDPVGFVVSENLRRRHLTDRQRAMVAAKLADLPRGRPTDNSADWRNKPTTAQAAEQLGVSERMVERARAVITDGVPELTASVEAGAVSISAAEQVAKLPQAAQAEIVAKGPEAVKEAAAEARRAKVSEPKPKADKPSRDPNGLSGLTREGLEDEVVGLRAENSELREKLKKVTGERDELKAQLRDHTADDKDEVIRRLTKEVKDARNARWQAEEKGAAWSRQVHVLKKRVAELENTEIEM